MSLDELQNQAELIPPNDSDPFHDGRLPSLLVRASAGTGKTYRLTARLLQILLQGAAPETILATTFTRKAAGEILERVLLNLSQAADPNHPEALEDLRQQVGLPTLPSSACLQLLKKLVANIHRVRICTLDSLFTQLAKSFPFELRLPPAWRLTDEIEEVWLRERAVEIVIGLLDPSELTTLLSMLSKGETKRSVVTELLQVVSDNYSISRQADLSVWQTLDVPTQPDSRVLTAAAGQFRMADPPQKSVRAVLDKIADSTEARQFSELVEETFIFNYAKSKRTGEEMKFGRSKLPEGLDEPIGAVYAAVRSAFLSRLRAQNEATGNVLSLYDGQIDDLKLSMRCLGFEDVAVRLATQFTSVDHAAVTRRLDGAINHILLDEFQDTSPAQWQVLRPLVQRVTDPTIDPDPDPELAVARSFFCVGDTKQAIYGWRGGVAEIFDTVNDQISGIQSIGQNQSFRSSQVIMDAVTQVFQNLTRHAHADRTEGSTPVLKADFEADAINQFAKAFPDHSAAKTLDGYVRMETCRKIEKGDASEKAQACYQLAAERIEQLHREAPNLSIGVLTRTNRTVAHLILLLEQLGVEVSQEGGNPLVDSAAVEIVLSALMMSEHPGDGRWEYHVANSPLAEGDGINATQVRESLTENGIARTVQSLAKKITPVCDARDTVRLKQLVQLAINYELNATARVRDFVRMVREKRVDRPQIAPVRVMTVHQSKGLEFDAVVLPELNGDLVSGGAKCVAQTPTLGEPPTGLCRNTKEKTWHFLDPAWRSVFGKEAADRMTEALCLLYVAMTRPRQALYLIAQPTKPDGKRAAAFIHAALDTDTDLTQGEALLYESGNPQWWKSH